MQGQHLYEYAVIRVLPRIEREEFINVGIILFSKRANYIKLLYTINEGRLRLFSHEMDIPLLKSILEGYDKICSGAADGGPIAKLEVAERFRWITAVKSSCVQTSRPHSGFSSNLDSTAMSLFNEMVL